KSGSEPDSFLPRPVESSFDNSDAFLEAWPKFQGVESGKCRAQRFLSFGYPRLDHFSALAQDRPDGSDRAGFPGRDKGKIENIARRELGSAVPDFLRENFRGRLDAYPASDDG